MATEIDAEAPHNNFDVSKHTLPGRTALPQPASPTYHGFSGASALTYRVADHFGVGFWQPDQPFDSPPPESPQCLR